MKYMYDEKGERELHCKKIYYEVDSIIRKLGKYKVGEPNVAHYKNSKINIVAEMEGNAKIYDSNGKLVFDMKRPSSISNTTILLFTNPSKGIKIFIPGKWEKHLNEIYEKVPHTFTARMTEKAYMNVKEVNEMGKRREKDED
jgi:hypothetical protein